ncbi:FecR family protein [Desertivirga brevis]|uniref:FecR family protein n=1 Tax=Desertivirga brevis TaxID=2810310 RepID=UPI001A97C24D|nr:FecR domain-containing protein [Pedobacter sp. SYSU D00873]
MKPKAPSELIDKFLKGKCSQEEEERLYRWYDSFENLSNPTTHYSEEEKARLREKMFGQIAAQLNIDPELYPRKKNAVSLLYRTLAGVAAMLFLAISITFYFQQTSVTKKGIVLPTYVSVKNSSRSLKKHVFPDGSIAWMRPFAQISYRKDYNSASSRDVTMQGEAFFEVAKNPKRPFIIKTGDVYTKVLGTSFNVRCNVGTEETEVSVVTGKVMVYTLIPNTDNVKQRTFLLPKESVVASVAEVKLEKRAETNNAMSIWRKETLSFNNTPVKDVVKALNERFASKIQIKDSTINQYQLKADFTNVNLPSVLELLSKSLGITYEINESGITMSKPID